MPATPARALRSLPGEVKNLASQTTKATDQIAGQITSVQQATQEAVAAIRRIGETIDSINHIASGISAAITEQEAATSDIANNVHRASDGAEVATGNISDVRAAAEGTGKAANDVLSAADALSRQAEEIRGAVDRFLAEVRADVA